MCLVRLYVSPVLICAGDQHRSRHCESGKPVTYRPSLNSVVQNLQCANASRLHSLPDIRGQRSGSRRPTVCVPNDIQRAGVHALRVRRHALSVVLSHRWHMGPVRYRTSPKPFAGHNPEVCCDSPSTCPSLGARQVPAHCTNLGPEPAHHPQRKPRPCWPCCHAPIPIWSAAGNTGGCSRHLERRDGLLGGVPCLRPLHRCQVQLHGPQNGE